MYSMPGHKKGLTVWSGLWWGFMFTWTAKGYYDVFRDPEVYAWT